MSGFVDRIFWSVLPGYPGAAKIGEIAREDKKSQLCCDCFYYYLFILRFSYFIIIYFTFFIYFTLLVLRSFHLVSGRESREIWKALLLFIIELCILDGTDQMKKKCF